MVQLGTSLFIHKKNVIHEVFVTSEEKYYWINFQKLAPISIDWSIFAVIMQFESKLPTADLCKSSLEYSAFRCDAARMQEKSHHQN